MQQPIYLQIKFGTLLSEVQGKNKKVEDEDEEPIIDN